MFFGGIGTFNNQFRGRMPVHSIVHFVLNLFVKRSIVCFPVIGSMCKFCTY